MFSASAVMLRSFPRLLGASAVMLRSFPRLLTAPALPFGTAALLLQTLVMEQVLPSRRNYSGDDAGRLGRIGNEIAAPVSSTGRNDMVIQFWPISRYSGGSVRSWLT